MWIRRQDYEELRTDVRAARNESHDVRVKAIHDLALIQQRNLDLERFNARLQSDLDWFKHRVTQLEKERGQLMLDRLGLAMPVPQFVPAQHDPQEAFNQLPRLDTVGNDAREESEDTSDPAAMLGRELAVSYDMMPRRN